MKPANKATLILGVCLIVVLLPTLLPLCGVITWETLLTSSKYVARCAFLSVLCWFLFRPWVRALFPKG